mmetsp:Transcript_6522/g.18316  ORF Transcript_6522/g.18316 Transcript_6522/m.18316 type:complete len:234 (+) Transcript_6522:483-1184(+)
MLPVTLKHLKPALSTAESLLGVFACNTTVSPSTPCLFLPEPDVADAIAAGRPNRIRLPMAVLLGEVQEALAVDRPPCGMAADHARGVLGECLIQLLPLQAPEAQRIGSADPAGAGDRRPHFSDLVRHRPTFCLRGPTGLDRGGVAGLVGEALVEAPELQIEAAPRPELQARRAPVAQPRILPVWANQRLRLLRLGRSRGRLGRRRRRSHRRGAQRAVVLRCAVWAAAGEEAAT